MSEKVSTPKASLVPGSIYLKENAEFVNQTADLAEKIYSSILRDPALKKNPIKKQAKQLFDNMLALTLAVSGRRDIKIILNKRRLADEEDGWILDDEKHLECSALIDIAQEDLLHAHSLWPKYEDIC